MPECGNSIYIFIDFLAVVNVYKAVGRAKETKTTSADVGLCLSAVVIKARFKPLYLGFPFVVPHDCKFKRVAPLVEVKRVAKIACFLGGVVYVSFLELFL